MSVRVTEKVIANPGKALLDKDMVIWNRKTKQLEKRDWERQDRPFQRVSTALTAMGRSSGEYVIPEYTPISDQGNRGTCVANSVMDTFEILMGIEHGQQGVVQLSRLFAYWIARYLHRETDKDDGTYLRALFYQLRRIGVVEEEFFPYSDTLEAVLDSPELDLYTMASNNRIDSFYRITSYASQRASDIETAIRANHPVAFSMPVNDAFCRYLGGGQVWSKMEDDVGNHAMILTGVRDGSGGKEFWVRNSWGAWWGDNGHCWMKSTLVTDTAIDLWVGTRIKNLV